MVDLMSSSLELMTNVVVLVTQPFSLLKFGCIFSLRIFFLFTHIWLQLVRASISLNSYLCWKIIVWMLAFVSLPLRILTALHRERLLEMHLHDMQLELENLAWDKKQLDERLQITLRDCRIMGSIISELEEDHEKAVAKLELLENELQDVKDENIRLRQIQEIAKWNLKSLDSSRWEKVADRDRQDTYGSEYEAPLLKTGYFRNEDKDLVHTKTWEDEKKKNEERTQSRELLRSGSSLSEHVVADEALYQWRGVALSRSFFSAILSILVGMIIWEAEDPCMPLVVALFIVVGMSLRSVVQFFSTIKNKPASDAVALLSFNWFVLGMLTYPTLPIVADVLLPLVPSLAEKTVSMPNISSSWWKE